MDDRIYFNDLTAALRDWGKYDDYPDDFGEAIIAYEEMVRRHGKPACTRGPSATGIYIPAVSRPYVAVMFAVGDAVPSMGLAFQAGFISCCDKLGPRWTPRESSARDGWWQLNLPRHEDHTGRDLRGAIATWECPDCPGMKNPINVSTCPYCDRERSSAT